MTLRISMFDLGFVAPPDANVRFEGLHTSDRGRDC